MVMPAATGEILNDKSSLSPTWRVAASYHGTDIMPLSQACYFDSQGLYEIHDASTTAHFSGLFSAMSDLSLCIASQPTVDQAAFKSPEDSANAHALD
jgi:hypothetical protein